jgi:hypothetical protein
MREGLVSVLPKHWVPVERSVLRLAKMLSGLRQTERLRLIRFQYPHLKFLISAP